MRRWLIRAVIVLAILAVFFFVWAQQPLLFGYGRGAGATPTLPAYAGPSGGPPPSGTVPHLLPRVTPTPSPTLYVSPHLLLKSPTPAP